MLTNEKEININVDTQAALTCSVLLFGAIMVIVMHTSQAYNPQMWKKIIHVPRVYVVCMSFAHSSLHTHTIILAYLMLTLSDGDFYA